MFRRRKTSGTFAERVLVYALVLSIVFPPSSVAWADEPAVTHTPEVPAAQPAPPQKSYGPECSERAFDEALRQNPLLHYSNKVTRTPIYGTKWEWREIPSDYGGGTQRAQIPVTDYSKIVGHRTSVGKWYFFHPYGFRSTNEDPDESESFTFEYNKQSYPHFRLQYNRLLAQALKCLSQVPKTENAPEPEPPAFLKKLKEYLEKTVPEDLSYQWDGARKKFHRKYTEALNEQIEAFEDLARLLNALTRKLRAFPDLAKGVADQLEEISNSFKEDREPKVSDALAQLALKLHELLKGNPEFSADTLEGQDRLLYELLFQAPPQADTMFGVPIAAQLRDLVVRGKSSKKDPKDFSLDPKANDYLFKSFPTGSPSLNELKALLSRPTTGTPSRNRRRLHGVTNPGEEDTPFYWLNQSESAAKAYKTGFQDISPNDRATALKWINENLARLDAAKGHGDDGSLAHLAVTREMLLDAKRKLEEADHGEEAPELDPFEYARSEHYLNEYKRDPANHAKVKRLEALRAKYEKATGAKLPPYAEWRYLNLHPFFKDLVDDYIELYEKKSNTEEGKRKIKSLMLNLSHEYIADLGRSDFGQNEVLTGAIEKMLREMDINPEDFEQNTGVKLADLMAALNMPRVPYNPWFERMGSVLGVGDNYKGEKVRQYLINQMEMRYLLRNLHQMTDPDPLKSLSTRLLNRAKSWFGLPTASDPATQKQHDEKLAAFLKDLKAFYGDKANDEATPEVLKAKIRALASKAGLPLDQKALDYLTAAGRATSRLMDKPDDSSYWDFDERQIGALTTFINLLDEVGHEPKQLKTPGHDRFHPNTITETLGREQSAKAITMSALHNRGVVPEGVDVGDYFNERFNEVRHRIMQDPSTGEKTLVHRGAPASTRMSLMQLMLPENESHVEMLERMGASHGLREGAATDNREHIPENLYRMLALGGNTHEVNEQLRVLDPAAYRHFACFHRPDTLKKSIIDSIIQNEGVVTPQALLEIELLAGTELYILEQGECVVLSIEDVAANFYDQIDPGPPPVSIRGQALKDRMISLRQDLGRLAADQVLRKKKTKYGLDLPGSLSVPISHVNPPDRLRGWVINDLILNDGQLSEDGERYLAELAMHEVDPETLEKEGAMAFLAVDLREKKTTLNVSKEVREKMDELKAELLALATKAPTPEQAARKIVEETAFAHPQISNELYERFAATLPEGVEITPEDRKARWKKFTEEHRASPEWKDRMEAEMQDLRLYAQMGGFIHDDLDTLDDRIQNPYTELPEEGMVVDLFRDALASVVRQQRAKAHQASVNANNNYRSYLDRVGPNPERHAIDVVRDRRNKDKEAQNFAEAIELAGRMQLLRSQIFGGGPDQKLSLAHLESRARQLRDNIPPATLEGRNAPEASLGAELNSRVLLFLKSQGKDYTQETNTAVSNWIALAGKQCAFGRDTSTTDQACADLEAFIVNTLTGGNPQDPETEKKTKLAHDFVKGLREDGSKRAFAAMDKEAKDYVALLLENMKDVSPRDRASLEHGALEVILDMDNRLEQRDESEQDQRALALELVMKHYKEELDAIADPQMRLQRAQHLLGTFQFALGEVGHDLAKLDSLAETSYLPFRQAPLTTNSPSFVPLLSSADEDWSGGNAALDFSGDPGAFENRLEALTAKAQRAHKAKDDKILALTRKLKAIGGDFDGVTVTLDERSNWDLLMQRGDLQLTGAGWQDLSSTNDWGKRFDERGVHRQRMEELQRTLDQLDDLGVPVAVNLNPTAMLSDAPSSYDHVVDAIITTNWSNLMTQGEWNPMSGDLAAKAEFDHEGNLVDVNFSHVSTLQRQLAAQKKMADNAYNYYNKTVDDYGSFWGSTLPHFLMNLGNYGSEWKNERQLRMEAASNEYLHLKSLMQGYGGIPVDDEDGLNGHALYTQELAKAKGILIKERATIDKVLADIDILEEVGWTVIITVGTMGVGAYLTTVANAARLIQAGRVAVQGGRLIAVGAKGARATAIAGRTMRLAGWSARAAEWLAVGNRIKFARGILATVRYGKHAAKKGLEGAAFSLGGLEIMTLLENRKVRNAMLTAMEDYNSGKFDPKSEEYRKKFGEEWGYIDSDGDGIPDWHPDDMDQEQQYFHPTFAQTWDTAESGFLFFAGMTAAGPLKVPYLPPGWQGVNQRLFAPTIHVAAGSLTTDLGMGVRRGTKGLDEALVDAGLTGLIMAPAAFVASSPAFYKLPGAQRFGVGRGYAITGTTATIYGSHLLGEPAKHKIKELLGFDVPEVHQNKDYWQHGAELGQHAFFAWLMTKGGKIAHIQEKLKAPNADIEALRTQYKPAEFNAALASIPRHKVETGYETPTATGNTRGLIAHDGSVARRQPTSNEPLLRELASREGMDVDTYALLLQLSKMGIKPADFANFTPAGVFELSTAPNPRVASQKPVLSSNNSPVTLPGETPVTGREPRTDFIREMLGFKPKGAKEVYDSSPSEIGELGGAFYRRMWEIARNPEGNGVPREKLTEEMQAHLQKVREQLGSALERNPALIGQFNPKTDDLAAVEMGPAIHRFGAHRTAQDALALTGKPIDPRASQATGELFATYVLKARAEGTEATTMDYLYNQFQLKASHGQIRFTENDWVRYETVYGKPRPEWAPASPPTAPMQPAIPGPLQLPRLPG